jgi:microcystin-dependent protein
MVDTTTPLLGMLLMGTGGDNNAWGQNLNDQVISRLDNIIAGVRQVTVNANPYTLSATDLGYNTMSLNGAITADQVIIVPELQRRFSIINNLTGAFFCILQTTAAGNKINLPSGKFTGVVVPANTFVAREDGHQVGELFYHASPTAPPGALACDGTAFKRVSAVDLFSKITTIWGNNDGTDFKVPNGQDTNRYLRSSSGGLAVGVSQANQNKTHTHTGAGTTSVVSNDHTHTGSGTTSAMSANASHAHGVSGGVLGGTGSPNGSGGGAFITVLGSAAITINATNTDHTHTYAFTTSGISANHTHTYSFTTSTGSADGTEARPESLVGLLCIRY